ncbi:MAG: NUDIX hydrolase [Clostridiales bacterium]|nr:NUDIX hydrolase [Clostridiales bacterium]
MKKKDQELREKITSKKTLFQGKIFDTELWQVVLPNGKTVSREAVIHPGGVSVFALCNNATVPLVKQHRVVGGDVLWELPAGKLEPSENPVEGIKRELEEEVGLVAENWEPLITFYPTPAYCSEQIHLFYANNIRKTKQHLDEDEFLQVHFFTLEELREMIRKREITDGKTLVGIFLAFEKMKTNKSIVSNE